MWKLRLEIKSASQMTQRISRLKRMQAHSVKAFGFSESIACTSRRKTEKNECWKEVTLKHLYQNVKVTTSLLSLFIQNINLLEYIILRLTPRHLCLRMNNFFLSPSLSFIQSYS